MAGLPRWAALVLTLGVLATATLAAEVENPKVVILRGTLGRGTTDLQYIADDSSLDAAKLSGVSGTELLALQGNRLKEQAEFFRQAQVSAGTPASKCEPIYVLLDPQGTWAYAQPWATFTYTRDGKKVGPLTSPMLLMGEQMTHGASSGALTPETEECNDKILAQARTWYAEVAAKGKKSSKPDLDRDVLSRWTLTTSSGKGASLDLMTDEISTQSCMRYLQQFVVSDLNSKGLDGSKLWSEFAAKAEVSRLVEEGNRSAVKHEVAETIAHELGHVVQFSSLGLYGYRGWGSAVHMDGSNHTLQTLSTPEFALIEGWAEANSMVVMGTPKESTAGDSNRINYGSTQNVVLTKWNQKTADLVAQKLAALKPDQANQPLVVPSFSTPREDFLQKVKESAQARGLTEEAWNQVMEQARTQPELAQLARAKEYLDSLQARKGQLKSRYDFLRSEWSVAGLLSKLRQTLGFEKSALVLKTMFTRKPKTTADLIEAFVHDNPSLKVEMYKQLATITEGILVTKEQAEWVEAEEKAGRQVEIDVDRNGKVPGTSANAQNPALFPAEPAPMAGVADPLGYTGPGASAPPAATSAPAAAESASSLVLPALSGSGQDTVVSVTPAATSQTEILAPAAGPRTAPSAIVPDMGGLEAR